MMYEGTVWQCHVGTCLVIQDFGRSDDGTSYMKVLVLDHVHSDTIGLTWIFCNIEKNWIMFR
jgi:hypothetical protein